MDVRPISARNKRRLEKKKKIKKPTTPSGEGETFVFLDQNGKVQTIPCF